MFDTLQVIFWSLTYILIIIAGFQSKSIKKVSIPYLAAIQNFTWEFCALIVSGLWAHIAWFSLDLMIVFWGLFYIRSKRNKILYLSAFPIGIVIFYFIFLIPNGMLFSSFVIDLLMAVYFLIERKKLSPKLKVPIAITKLIGDAFAGFHYAPQSKLIGIITCLVFICNLSYLYLCMEESK